ncbi:MAG: hypothetical protein WC263_01875 [Candidatus Micrarchaeia archaeon]|jgi:hypothetical protein
MRKSTLLGVFVLISYAVLFFGLFGDLPVARAGVGLLVLLDMLAFAITLPQGSVRWRPARKAIQYLSLDAGGGARGYAPPGYNIINTQLSGLLYSLVMMALVLLLGAILGLPNLGLSFLICLLSGLLIVRMQLANDLETEGGAYFSAPGQ